MWASNRRHRLEKREITVGEYDEENERYQITGGITGEDEIAPVAKGLREGMKTELNSDYDDDAFIEEETSDGVDYDTGEADFEAEDFSEPENNTAE